MRPTLPSAFDRKVSLLGTLLMTFAFVATAGCKHVTKDPPITAGPPIPAEPEVDLENVDTECAGMLAAYERYGQCPNLEEDDRRFVRSVIEAAEEAFAAGKKAQPDEPTQKAMAMACRRAAVSIGFATQRCQAGKRPRID
jgi:hypothetical protein